MSAKRSISTSKKQNNTMKTVTVIGLGLMGGSISLSIKNKKIFDKIIGVEANDLHKKMALELNLVDEISDLKTAIEKSNFVILSVPVNIADDIILEVLDQIKHQIVMDMGSTKESIILKIKNHPKRNQFVATHPMWGTEYSGPEAAVNSGFIDKAVVICDKENSSKKAIEEVENLYKSIGMHIIYMNPTEHDLHAAYVSHISHITSFALANTVLEKEKENNTIFELASGGFESTVRLAKSNPNMWVPIFKQNKENILDVLNEHISQLRKFKSCLEKENYEYMYQLIEQANNIKKIIK